MHVNEAGLVQHVVYARVHAYRHYFTYVILKHS